MSILDSQDKILEQLQQGEFVAGMEEFYADDAVNEEVTGDRIEGKTAIIAHEHEVLANVAAYHGCEVFSRGGSETSPGNGVTFAEYALEVDLKDGSSFNPEQVQVMRWRDGQAVHIKFYYDPSQL